MILRPQKPGLSMLASSWINVVGSLRRSTVMVWQPGNTTMSWLSLQRLTASVIHWNRPTMPPPGALARLKPPS